VNDRFSLIFAGGGTGGHLYPAIAIAQALGDHADVTFIGTAGRLEAKIVPQAGYVLETVRSSPLTRKISFAFVATAFINALGVFEAMRVLLRHKPEIVIATGGYVCFPVVIAARILRAMGRTRAPIVLFEPNARPGLANRTLARLTQGLPANTCRREFRFVRRFARFPYAKKPSNGSVWIPHASRCSRWVGAKAPARSTVRSSRSCETAAFRKDCK
jgi:UDP-N-acetylglucosamine--N-acetylmuramyl-(pentapeptide) pyrophosphoryl-undecaprenol N-acetylglucosamine transferase